MTVPSEHAGEISVNAATTEATFSKKSTTIDPESLFQSLWERNS
jgi:hypothetical protein